MHARRRIEQRVYALSRRRPVTGVPGTGRVASRQDRDLLVEWTTAFRDEALAANAPQCDATSVVDAGSKPEREGFMAWEDERRPMSLAGWGGETPNGVRVGPVYT